MDIELHASEWSAQPPERTFDFVTDSPSFPRYFPGNALIPAVDQVQIEGPLPQRPGTLRKVRVADGSCVTERVDVWEPPREHAYSLIEGFRPPTSWLFTGARACWLLQPDRDGTRIDWYYSYHLRNILLLPVAWLVMKLGFQRAMQNCLERMCQELAR